MGDAVTSITDVGAACEAGRLIVEGVDVASIFVPLFQLSASDVQKFV